MLLVVRKPHSVWHLFQKNYLIFYLSFCRINLVEVFVVEIHGEKFIKFKIFKKKTHQEKELHNLLRLGK